MPRAAFVIATLLLGAATALAAMPSVVLPEDLPHADGVELRRVVLGATVSTHVNGQSFVARRQVLEFLLDHPEFTTQLARALDLGSYRVWREPDGLWIHDGGGVVGRFRVVYAAGSRRVVHVRGRYDGRFVPTIHGEVVVDFEYALQPAANGKSVITPAVSGFVKIDNAVVNALARLFHGVATRRAEETASRIVRDFARATQMIEEQPARVHAEVGRHPETSRRDLEEFRRLLKLP